MERIKSHISHVPFSSPSGVAESLSEELSGIPRRAGDQDGDREPAMDSAIGDVVDGPEWSTEGL